LHLLVSISSIYVSVECSLLTLFSHASPSSAIPLFFFLTSRPPPISTLFPYTTLFRSEIFHHVRDLDLLRTDSRAGAAPYAGGGTDRKSTRLNSSHVSISYAVFCLKKKNKYIKHHVHRRFTKMHISHRTQVCKCLIRYR